jgi:hypothetical protein
MLPTLVVCNGDTGDVVTHWGRAAVTTNPNKCIDQWRQGHNGLSLLSILGLDDVPFNCNTTPPSW